MSDAKKQKRRGAPAAVDATATVSGSLEPKRSQESKRLELLGRMCSNMAMTIANAREVLRDNAESADTAYLVADVLDRVGWIADQATVVAGTEKYPMTCGDADGWMLNGLLHKSLGGDHGR